jgi:hypothetical protein
MKSGIGSARRPRREFPIPPSRGWLKETPGRFITFKVFDQARRVTNADEGRRPPTSLAVPGPVPDVFGYGQRWE